MQALNDDPLPTVTCFEQIRASKPARGVVDLFQRHPSFEFTIKNIFKTSQAVAAGYCSWKATQIYNDPLQDAESSDSETEFVITTFLATTLLLGAIAGSFFRNCQRRNFNQTRFSLISSGFLVFAATCLGVSLASKQQFNRAAAIWNNISQTNSEIEYTNQMISAEFDRRINNCLNETFANRELFTLPECYICDMTTSSRYTIISFQTFDSPEIFQTQIVNFNQTLCPPHSGVATLYWNDFTSMTFNETRDPWPCLVSWPTNMWENKSLDGTCMVMDYMLGLLPPFSVQVTPIANNSAGCVNAVGFGVRQFSLQSLCGLNRQQYNELPTGWTDCFTEEATVFAENYTNNYQPLILQTTLPYPVLLVSMVKGQRSKIPYIVMGYLGTTLLGLFIWRQWKKNNRHVEEQPLLAEPV